MLKRVLVVFLSVCVLISSFALSAFAAAESNDMLVISDCDTLDGWSGSNLAPTTNPAQSCGSQGAINRNGNYGIFMGTYTAVDAMDISDYTYIEWDMMYMLNGDTTGKLWKLVKNAYGTSGGNYLYLKVTDTDGKRDIWRLSKLEVTQPYANLNWLHFKAKIGDVNTSGGFDPSKFKSFYFTTCDVGQSAWDTSIGGGTIRIDNLFATGKKAPVIIAGDANDDKAVDVSDLVKVNNYINGTAADVAAGADINSNGIINKFDMQCIRKIILELDYSSDTEDVKPLVINDCEAITGWTAEHTATGIAVQTGRGVNGTSAIYAFGGSGALRRITYTPDAPINLAANPSLEWDQYTVVSGGDNNGQEQFETVYNAYKNYAAVAVSDGVNTVAFDVTKWQVGAVGVGNYRHIAVSLANSGLDLSNITSISFYTLPVGVGTVNSDVRNAAFRFDNIIATANAVIPNWATGDGGSDNFGEITEPVEDINITNCEDKAYWHYENGDGNISLGSNLGIDGSYIAVVSGYGALRKLTYTSEETFDLSKNKTIEWDMVITETSNGLEYFYAVAEAYSSTMCVEVSDGTNTKYLNVSEWQVGESNNNKWRHISVSLENSGLNLANITSVSFAALPLNSGNVNASLSGNVIYRFDNIKATGNKAVSNWNGTGDSTGTAFMPSMFSDGMLFQQNKDINLWGITAKSGESVKAVLSESGKAVETVNTVSDKDGNWSLAFSPRVGGYSKYTINVTAGNQSKQINNILIGELWIASGQSNMEFFLGNTVLAADRANIPTDEYIRVFKEPSVPTEDGADGVLSAVPVYDVIKDVNNVNSIGNAAWVTAASEPDIRYVSAIAYYTCIELREKLDVPVGFINTAKGASVIESWLSRESIDSNDIIKSKLEEKSLYMSPRGLNAPKNWQYMTTLYNTKLAPLAGLNSDNQKRSAHAGFNIAGVMWYQGESNIKYADDNGTNTFYKAALDQLINDWSVIFGFEKGKIPFVFADIAPYDYSNVRSSDYDTIIPLLSEAMAEAAELHKDTAVQIPIYDLPLTYKNPPIQDFHPIHPSDKKSVAKRFSSAILRRFYNIGDTNFAAPILKSSEVSGNKIIVTLNNVGNGLAIKNNGTNLYGFAICGADRIFVNAEAKIISSNKLEISSPFVENPVAASYAFSSYNVNANLVNSLGIPCIAFRTDKVDSVYFGTDDWISADFERVWSSSCKTLTGDTYSTWKTDASGAKISFDTEIKDSGVSSIKLTTTAANKGAGPDLSLASIRNHYSDYKYLAVKVKNDDNIVKKLKLRIGTGAYAKTVDGLFEAELSPNSDFETYIFDISNLVNSNGAVLSDTARKNAFSLNSIMFVVDTAGSVHIDDIKFATNYQ